MTAREVTALVAAERPRMVMRARRVGLSVTEAEDSVSAAELILWRSHQRLNADAAPGWLHVVARNEALRVHGQRLPVTEPAVLEGVFAAGGDRDPVMDAWNALASLKPDERRALILQAAGYSYHEMQELLGWTRTKLNRCMYEGRRTARKRIR